MAHECPCRKKHATPLSEGALTTALHLGNSQSWGQLPMTFTNGGGSSTDRGRESNKNPLSVATKMCKRGSGVESRWRCISDDASDPANTCSLQTALSLLAILFRKQAPTGIPSPAASPSPSPPQPFWMMPRCPVRSSAATMVRVSPRGSESGCREDREEEEGGGAARVLCTMHLQGHHRL